MPPDKMIFYEYFSNLCGLIEMSLLATRAKLFKALVT